MLPLRSHRKPQLLPIKQLLMKQRDDSTVQSEEHSVNTDDYLLWKSEQEPNEKKSVSFSLKNDGTRMKNRIQGLYDDKRLERTKQESGVGLWDSDEADDSLQNQLETLNNFNKYYDYENASLPGKSDKIRTRKKSAMTQAKRDNELVKKIVETVDLPIRESLDDMQHNLSILLEKKIREEISTLKRSDCLNEVNNKVTSIFVKLQDFENSHQQELLKLKSDLLNHLNSTTVNQTSSSEDLHEIEGRICEQITKNFREKVESLEDQIKNMNVGHESRKADVAAKYEVFFKENTIQIQELDAKIESLTKETSKILELVVNARQQNTKSIVNVAPRLSITKETSLKIGDINSKDFYRNVDAELEEYRSSYMNNNSPIDQYQTKTSRLFTLKSDSKWKPW